MSEPVGLADLDRAFLGVTPTPIATAAADGTPNVTYLSRLYPVDDQHLALSNQFFSKTSRNLAENQRASIAVFDPVTGNMFRLALRFVRTEHDGPVFEQLRTDVDATAALTGMQDVFRLRAADIYRVVRIERLYGDRPMTPRVDPSDRLRAVAQFGVRIAACTSLEALVEAVVVGVDELLGHRHVSLMLLDEDGSHLYTLASRGFDTEGVGSEIALGHGVIGMAAAQRAPVRVGNLRFMAKYSRALRRAWDDDTGPSAAPRVAMPRLAGAESRMAVPAVAFDRLVGVIVVDALTPVAFGPDDEAALVTVASLFAPAYEALRSQERATAAPAPSTPPTSTAHDEPFAPLLRRTGPVRVRHYSVDGSTFLDGDYLIKGVAGRILWSLLDQHRRDGRLEFTNRELRLDQRLGMPGVNDNLESRLILLSRRLDERAAPVRLAKTGRGRFRIELGAPVELELGG